MFKFQFIENGNWNKLGYRLEIPRASPGIQGSYAEGTIFENYLFLKRFFEIFITIFRPIALYL